jgi:hypothetical protein
MFSVSVETNDWLKRLNASLIHHALLDAAAMILIFD